MHPSIPRLATLLVPALLAGCALEPRAPAPPDTRVLVTPRVPSAADTLLGHLARVRGLEARELPGARDEARAAYQAEKTDLNRVRLALVLALLAGSGQDDAELMALTEPLLAPAVQPPEVGALASLLHGMAADRRRVREQLRDAQVRLANARKDDVKDAEARALKARVEELEARLAALKSIDRSVNSRRTETPRK